MNDLLLLHGALGSKDQLKPLQQIVGGHVIDFTGHGTKAIPDGSVTFDHFIADIDQLFAEKGLKQAHLFGYSMGGYAALLYAGRHPERVLSVVTLGTILVWSEEGLQKELRKLDPGSIEAKVPTFAQALARTHGADRWKTIVMAIAKSMTALARDPLLTDRVMARITCPVMCCVGENDASAIPDNTRAFAARLPNAEALVLPGTKHPFEDVKLDALVQHLRSFWSKER